MRATIILLCACLLTLAACNKEQREPIGKNANTKAIKTRTITSSSRTYVGYNPPNRTWYKTILDCAIPAKDCLPEVIFSVPKLNELRANIGGFGPIAIGGYFSSTEGVSMADDLQMNDDILDSLSSGRWGMLESASGSNSDIFYFHVGPDDGTLSTENAVWTLAVNVAQ